MQDWELSVGWLFFLNVLMKMLGPSKPVLIDWYDLGEKSYPYYVHVHTYDPL